MKNLITVIALLMTLTATSQSNDQIIKSGLKQLNIEDVNVRVLPFSDKIYAKFGDGSAEHIKAYVEGQGKYYTIYIKDIRGNELLEVLSHELIHIKQMYSLEMVKKGNKVTFKGKDYNDNEIAYESKPWEVDAFREGNKLKNRIKKGF